MPVTYLTPRIFTIRSALSPDECQRLIEKALEHGIADQDFGRTGRPDIRGRLAVDDDESQLENVCTSVGGDAAR